MNNIVDTSNFSPIEARRRGQIIDITITILGEIGYTKTSMVKIARRANISIGLIPYHFKNKNELMRQTLEEIMSGWYGYVAQEVAKASPSTHQLEIYIRANFQYMTTHTQLFPALIEIVFNARNADGVLMYRNDKDDPALTLLEDILARGRESGEFKQEAGRTSAIAIRASIDQFLGQLPVRSNFDIDQYTNELIELVFAMVVRD
jgi:AcrR family transcriptional regulator